jgi:hypothetical protein
MVVSVVGAVVPCYSLLLLLVMQLVSPHHLAAGVAFNAASLAAAALVPYMEGTHELQGPNSHILGAGCMMGETMSYSTTILSF